MKKYLSMVLALLLCLCTAASALADVTITYSHSVTDQRNLYYSQMNGTNLLRVNTGNGYALTDLNGNMITGDHYYQLYAEKGYITAMDLTADPLNCNGAFNLSGEMIVPFRYGVVKAESDLFCLGIVLEAGTADSYDFTDSSKTEYYRITSVDVYRMPEGKLLATLTRDQYMDCDAKGLCLDIVDRNGVVTTYDADFNALGVKDNLYSDANVVYAASAFRDNGRYGLKDAQGNVLVEPIYNSVYVNSYGMVDIRLDDKDGLMALDGTVVIEPAWSNVCSGDSIGWHNGSYTAMVVNGYAAVELDDKVGYVSTITGETTLQPKYAEDIVDVHGVTYSLTDLSGNFLIVAADGVESTLSGYNRVASLYATGGYLYTIRNDEYEVGLVDWHGNVLLDMEYNGVHVSGDGMKLIVVGDGQMDIYDIHYPGTAVPAEEEPALSPAVGAADAAVQPSVQPAAHPAVSVLESAVVLLESNPAVSGPAVVTLLETAAAMVSDNPSAAALLPSAIMLIQADPAGNAAAVITLIQTIIGML